MYGNIERAVGAIDADRISPVGMGVVGDAEDDLVRQGDVLGSEVKLDVEGVAVVTLAIGSAVPLRATVTLRRIG